MTNKILEEQVKKLNTFLITWKEADKASSGSDMMVHNIVTAFDGSVKRSLGQYS